MVASAEDDRSEMPVVPGQHPCVAGGRRGYHAEIGKINTSVGVPARKVEGQFQFGVAWCVELMDSVE